jgi:glycerol uptake facilitator-like aquaporin
MIDIILDTLIDSLKLLPFLFIAFLIIELIEHKLNKQTKELVSKSGKVGPLIGSLLGLFPQCGFSVMATNLYVTRIITLGTLISIYLATSDEMLPIMLSQKIAFIEIVKLLVIKFICGIIWGFIIDLLLNKKSKKENINYEICDEDHCNCHEEGVIKSTLIHTLKTLLFIMLVSFLLNILLHFIGEDNLSKLFLKNSIFGPFISSLLGLIPNCGSSIVITELYLNGAISLGSAMAGLLTGSGVALLVLFKENKDIKENVTILSLLYGLGVISGIIIELITMIF